jgi:hypothetical protein
MIEDTKHMINTETRRIPLFVYDQIEVLEFFESTSCVFLFIDSISFGYRTALGADDQEGLNRAFDVLFEETVKRFRSG